MPIAIDIQWESEGNFSKWVALAIGRSADLTPLAYRIKQYYQATFTGWVALNPAGDGEGDTGELGSSISAVEKFSVTTTTIIAGTPVPYAEHYANYRRSNGLPSLLPDNGETLEGLGSIVMDWITQGRT